MTETKLEDVVEQLGTNTKAGGHPRFSDGARLAAVEYATGRMAQGQLLEDVAAELKLNKWTLQKWLQRERRGDLKKQGDGKPGFARVKVKARADGVGARLVVHGAHGVRVEGLTLENIATLLERLGCSA